MARKLCRNDILRRAQEREMREMRRAFAAGQLRHLQNRAKRAKETTAAENDMTLQDKRADMREKLNPLAAFQYVPASPKLLAALRRLNAMLSTYSGMDRSMMLVQVGSLC